MPARPRQPTNFELLKKLQADIAEIKKDIKYITEIIDTVEKKKHKKDIVVIEETDDGDTTEILEVTPAPESHGWFW